MSAQKTFLEFFAGGGMARLGLGDSWRCLLANDLDGAKCAAYRTNFGDSDLIEGDIEAVSADSAPQTRVDLVWGSFPCQDLSLAGARAGMGAARSGAFFPFWRIAEDLVNDGRGPRIIAIENVTGLLTSNQGRDFACVIERLTGAGYTATAIVLDAKAFIPQSRPRLFILGFAPDLSEALATIKNSSPEISKTTPAALIAAYEQLSGSAKERWMWLSNAPRKQRNTTLSTIIDWEAPNWHTHEQTRSLIAMMSPRQKERIDAILANGARRAGAAFRRTRVEGGETVQRVEARFDGLAGCLRTPAGGSSRQIVFAIENGAVRSRLLSPREAARLMGLPEEYVLPSGATAALKLAGDGVCVPVVRWLAENIFEPALARAQARKAA